MLNKSDESEHHCPVPDLRENASSFSPFSMYDVSCGLGIYGLYYVEVQSFYTQCVENFYLSGR